MLLNMAAARILKRWCSKQGVYAANTELVLTQI